MNNSTFPTLTQMKKHNRESEPLTPLDSHRQSGGERAVSTIFYLMSLQSLTRSPFRVVDEINQGMDPRNERLVHKRMVGIACGSTAAAAASTSPVHGNPDNIYTDHDDDNAARDDDEDEDEEVEGDNPDKLTSGSQYFLITPKLLHDLEYQWGMQVLCIASGEYMPEDRTRVDFKGCLDLMKGLRAEEMAAGGRRMMGVAAG